MPDPTRREVDTICMRIDKVNKQLKPLGKTQELPPKVWSRLLHACICLGPIWESF
jgi:hypothetical protein